MLELARTLNFKKVPDVRISDALEYARWQGIPETFVRQNILRLVENRIVDGHFTNKLLQERGFIEQNRRAL